MPWREHLLSASGGCPAYLTKGVLCAPPASCYHQKMTPEGAVLYHTHFSVDIFEFPDFYSEVVVLFPGLVFPFKNKRSFL
jgi:hypothetical protein